jgi:hypothetical protein
MKTFYQWCEEKKLDLTLPEELEKTEKTEKPLETEIEEEPTSENRARTGVWQNYPPAYFRAQYPKDHYTNPYIATAETAKVMKPKRIPDNQP